MANQLIQITAYLRTKEDLKRWKALKNKTEFIHQSLELHEIKERLNSTKDELQR